ncbi:CHY zinc finger protein [Corynebacterium felinum]|uniref:CHY-type Zn-finger protein n=1 Tax=Corynebacterium felinum TaxID=131318 RepID=A0ABU2B8L8_9CORY|nr:CHY zinc finger protein [Corynebacterium felinum]MDF5821112.1 CHY zinc finger protein [Corynebacterium felinum]MDR7354980.1 putative CHY-type Zn-finger protein [Corynebacterium felinum]WJY94336.1 CHY zinc finger [Corynebacterium felinum]
MAKIRGIAVDTQGRCVHYRTAVDVVANLCATCHEFYACHLCHGDLADHEFGRVDFSSAMVAVICGVCGYGMTPQEYAQTTDCPACGCGFNPGCAAHRNMYFTCG